MRSPKAGDIIGGLQLNRKLGAGGNGEVWQAESGTGSLAIKILRPRMEDSKPRFKREISTLEMLRGIPGVLPLVDYDRDNTSPDWYSMPLAIPIREKMGPQPSIQVVAECVSAIASVLAAVHSKDISHRDIKPDNLFWYDGRWSVGDFGLADHPLSEPLTDGGRKLGPAYYIAPEMLNDPARNDCRPADIYSLGKTLWVLASGQNYPLPGEHDPSIRGMSLSSVLADPFAGSIDELLRRMTHFEPVRRVSAELVAQELGHVSKKLAGRPSEDGLEDTLSLLRSAVQPHKARKREEERQLDLRDEVAKQLEQTVTELAWEIQERTGIQPEQWNELPEYWQARKAMGMPQVVDMHESGYAFRAGARWSEWEFAIGFRCDLMDSGTLHMTVGFGLDQYINGRLRRVMGQPTPWHKTASALNGGPECATLVADLVAQLHAEFPQALRQWSALIAKSE